MTASCGIACNKLLAKICGGVNKPDGMTYLGFSEEEIQAFMDEQYIRKIPGIGKVNEMILKGIGVQTCKDIVSKGAEIYLNFTPNAWSFLMS